MQRRVGARYGGQQRHVRHHVLGADVASTAARTHRPRVAGAIRLSAGTMPAMHPITISALEAFPRALEQHYAAFPARYVHWKPASWDGVPSEPFTAIEQI